MEAAHVISTLNSILIDEFELEADTIVPEALLREDLDLDSLDAVDLIVAIERAFGFRLEDSVVMEMRTVKDMHDYVHAKLNEVAEA